jgi:hypothetical protein
VIILNKIESMNDNELKYERLVDCFYVLIDESKIYKSDEKLHDRYMDQINRVRKILQKINNS